VLHVWQPTEWGVPVYATTLVRALADRGWDVHAALPGGRFADELERTGIPVHRIAMTRSPGPADLGAARALRALDRDYGFDLVHAHSTKAGILARAALPRRRRLVYTPHCFAFVGAFSPVQRAGAWVIEQLLVPRTGLLLSAGPHETRVANRRLLGLRRRVREVTTGVAMEGEQPHAELERFASGRILAGMVAGLRPQKDPVALVRAAALLRDAGRLDFRLAIVGNGELAGAVGDEIARLGLEADMRLFPFEVASEPYLRALDFFVLPSLWEAFPIAVLEAMACALPVVATAVGGTVDLVRDGENGLLVAPGDAGALAGAMARLAADAPLRASMGARGQHRVATHHTLAGEVAAVERAYAELGFA
jgi:glycosyltransferase involved in cell wall biosynthesis